MVWSWCNHNESKLPFSRKLWAFVQYTAVNKLLILQPLVLFDNNHLFLCFPTTTLWNDAFASTQLVSYMQVAVYIHWSGMEDWNHVMGPCNNILKLIWLTEVGKTVIKYLRDYLHSCFYSLTSNSLVLLHCAREFSIEEKKKLFNKITKASQLDLYILWEESIREL